MDMIRRLTSSVRSLWNRDRESTAAEVVPAKSQVNGSQLASDEEHSEEGEGKGAAVENEVPVTAEESESKTVEFIFAKNSTLEYEPPSEVNSVFQELKLDKTRKKSLFQWNSGTISSESQTRKNCPPSCLKFWKYSKTGVSSREINKYLGTCEMSERQIQEVIDLTRQMREIQREEHETKAEMEEIEIGMLGYEGSLEEAKSPKKIRHLQRKHEKQLIVLEGLNLQLRALKQRMGIVILKLEYLENSTRIIWQGDQESLVIVDRKIKVTPRPTVIDEYEGNTILNPNIDSCPSENREYYLNPNSETEIGETQKEEDVVVVPPPTAPTLIGSNPSFVTTGIIKLE